MHIAHFILDLQSDSLYLIYLKFQCNMYYNVYIYASVITPYTCIGQGLCCEVHDPQKLAGNSLDKQV